MSKRVDYKSVSAHARPQPLQYIPKEQPKVPKTTSQWFLFKAQNVYRQLTLNWGRKLVVGAFPFIAYFSLTFFDYRRTRYNFQLQQADFFKQSVACIANSPEVKEAYGADMKLKRATFWTVTSGFVPWITERHVWLGFSGQKRDGWIRMGLRRTDFVLDKEVVKLISNDIEQGLKRDLQQSLAVAKGEEVSDNVSSKNESVGESSVTSKDTEDPMVEPEASVEYEVEQSTVDGEFESESSEKETSDMVDHDESNKTESIKERSLTTKERIEQQVAEKEIQDQLNQEQHDRYMAEMRRLYPTLPENFGQNDVEQAVAIKKDRLLDGKIFSNTWDLLSLSIHPEKAEDGPVYVLWDPDDTYVDQANFWIDTAWLSIKKPESMRTAVAARNPASTVGS
ncbi:hypothetical protein ACHWQZ_G014381 [Mnemiopsis leidyi]